MSRLNDPIMKFPVAEGIELRALVLWLRMQVLCDRQFDSTFRLSDEPPRRYTNNTPRPQSSASGFTRSTVFHVTICLAAMVALTRPGPAPADNAAGVEFFEKKIRPILVENCYACHSEASGKQKGSLFLDSRDGVRTGGDSGPAIVPGKPKESLLIIAIKYIREDLRMPPPGKLPDAAIADLEKWIEIGAPDPRDKAAGGAMTFEASRSHWAFQPVRNSPRPVGKFRDWATSPIDAFMLARLEASGLTPSPPADRRALLRRLYVDLVGLPPTAEEVEGFEKDTSPDAFAKVVDRLLASPAY